MKITGAVLILACLPLMGGIWEQPVPDPQIRPDREITIHVQPAPMPQYYSNEINVPSPGYTAIDQLRDNENRRLLCKEIRRQQAEGYVVKEAYLCKGVQP